MNESIENKEAKSELRGQIINVMRTVFDPEIPVNIYELGLIYEIQISESNNVHVKMTLTSPSCPEAGVLPGQVQDKVMAVPGVSDCNVELVWDPMWNMNMMSEAARLQLNV
jgi:FeS assembly SUF system protein